MAQRQEATKLGKELRKLRVDFEISRATMANVLKISDRELSLIEIGKSQVTDDLLVSVSQVYLPEGLYENQVLSSLRAAHADSVKAITFDMTLLTCEQRAEVLELKRSVDAHSQLLSEKAELEAKRLKEEKLAERKAKQARTKAMEEPQAVPEEKLEVRTKQTLREAVKRVEPESEVSLDDLDALMADLEGL